MSGAGDHCDERGPQRIPPSVPSAGAPPPGAGQLDNTANHRQPDILLTHVDLVILHTPYQ